MAESVLDSLTKKVDQLETTKAVTVNADVSDAQSKIERLASTLESVANVVVGINVALKDVNDNLGDFQSGDMADLVEKLKKMSEHTGKLKENLEALTSKTWTINIDINIDKQIDKIVDKKLDSLRRELDQQVNGVITPRVNDIYARMSVNERKTTQTERDIKELPKRFLRRQ